MAVDVPGLLRLIAEDTRYGLLRRLQQGPATVGQLTQQVDGEQTNVSHHLRVLREAGLVRALKVGRHQQYRLADPEVGRLLEHVQALARQLDRISYSAALGLPQDAAFHGYG